MKIEEVFLATGNPNKCREIEAIMTPLGISILTTKDVGPIGRIVEDGDSFEANAIKKACESARRTRLVSLADDSGLEVDALNGAPGIYSSRYAGDNAGDPENIRKLLAEMSAVPDGKRSARFRCVIAMAAPDGKGGAEVLATAEGAVKGRILREQRGDNGFGYDPIFFHEPSTCTFAQLSMEDKARVSHRGLALAQLARCLRKLMHDERTKKGTSIFSQRKKGRKKGDIHLFSKEAQTPMDHRQCVIDALEFRPPDKVPFCFPMTDAARVNFEKAVGSDHPILTQGDSVVWVGVANGAFRDLGNDRFKDIFGVVWNRTVDKDIGVVENKLLPKPSLAGLDFPDPDDEAIYANVDRLSQQHAHRFREAVIGFSLHERAWTLRGMTDLFMDMIDNPPFIHDLLDAICDWNLKVIANFLEHDLDAIHFGDDWGQQTGLQMGAEHWRTFYKPRLARMYRAVRDAGKYVTIHSCGKVDELFDDLVEMGLNCFNPFQPEVMDVYRLHDQYLGRLAFHGGVSTQKLMPYGSPDDVRKEVARMISMGQRGGLIVAPAHALPPDVPVENMLAMLDVLMNQ